MPSYKPGQSGNPKGRPKGCLSKYSLLKKRLLESGEEIIDSLIREACAGKPLALALCVERLIPKLRYEEMEYTLPKKIKDEQREEIRLKIAQAVLNGQIGAVEADIVIKMVLENKEDKEIIDIDVSNITDEEAEECYQDVMRS